jgi:hypothetical protein
VSVIILLLVLSAAALSNTDEISTLFSSWLEGRPRMLVKLKIRLLQIATDRCAVLVKRFPTMYNPTEKGYTELLYKGLHPWGYR